MDQKSIREQTIKDAKCNFILDAALTVFAEKGFHETRLEDIAAAAGFSKASLYNYYSDKEEIFLRLVSRAFDDLYRKMSSTINENDPFFINLERLLSTSLEYFGQHFAIIVSTTNFHMMHQLRSDNKALSSTFCNHYKGIEQLHIKLIEQAQQNGEVSDALTAETVAHFIGSLARETMIRWKLKGKIGDIPTEIANIMLFIRQGIAVSL